MPFTPFHFGPGATFALPLNRSIDLPVFLLANVAVDFEPLLVMLLDLSYPLHGMAHTFAGGAIVGSLCGLMAYGARDTLAGFMQVLRLPYVASFGKYLVSGILGAWFHVLLDAPLYGDIKPFSPFSSSNPLFGTIASETMYTLCTAAVLPAIMLYLVYWYRYVREKKSRLY